MNKAVQAPAEASLGNQPVAGLISEAARRAMTEAAARKIAELLDVLKVDHRGDHNTRDTPARVARLLVEETVRGRFSPPPRIADFDNVERCDQLVVTGPIAVRSTCAHHLMPIAGHAIVGVLPNAGGRIVGLSTYDRIVDHFSA